MEMNPIYTGNLEPMGGYSRMSSEDEPDLVPQDTGSASRCHQRALMLITLLCCLLLSSNVVLLNLYMKQSSVAQETLQNISKLRSDEATLSDENLRLNRQIEALTSRNTDLQTENSAGLLSNAALKTQNRNLTELLALCREENVELAVTNSNLTRTHGLLKDQAEELRNLSRLQQSQIANLSQSQDRLLEENLALASTDSTLLQWLEGLADRGENLTAEVARLSAEEHELALQYSALEKHCHTVQRPRRGPHNHHSKNNNDLTGKSLYFPHGGADRLVTFMPNQKKPLTAVTLCLRHSSNLAWGVSLLSPANREEMASFQCHPQECRVLVNGVTSTAGLGDASGPAESWSHTCTTWRSDTAAVQLWVNGVASAKHRGSGQRTEWLVESITLQRLAGSGLVTDLHLWDYALTDCQIQTLAAGLSITTGNLLEWSNLSRRHAGQGEIQIKPLQESCSGSH